MESTRVAALDGIRGFAALAVLPYHALLPLHPAGLQLHGTPIWEIPYVDDQWFKFWIALFNGECAVILFFVLSGLVLIKSIERDLTTNSALSASVAFLVRRLLRIMPAVIACVLAMAVTMWVLSLLFPGVVTPFEPKAVLHNLLLISPSVNGASWTLQAEMIAVPFLVVAGLMAHRFGILALWMFLVFAFVVTRLPIVSDSLYYLGGNILYFALGCLIPYTASALRKVIFLPWWATLIMFLAVKQVMPNTLGFYLQAVFGFLFVAQAYIQSPEALTGPVAQFLGRISYSLYLWNVLFLAAIFPFLPTMPWFAGHPSTAGLATSVVVAVLTIPVAVWSERFIETPGIRLGRRLTRRPSTPTSAVPAA